LRTVAFIINSISVAELRCGVMEIISSSTPSFNNIILTSLCFNIIVQATAKIINYIIYTKLILGIGCPVAVLFVVATAAILVRTARVCILIDGRGRTATPVAAARTYTLINGRR
jgi:hypothetical protein